MTGRKVTRRASMRRKSMRSPSVSRSNGSRTPRSVVSEPHASGKSSINDSLEKLDLNSENDNQLDLSVNNSSEQISSSNDRILSYASVAQNNEAGMSSSEILASEFAAVKIEDSKDNLVSEPAITDEEVAIEPKLVESKTSLNTSKTSISELVSKDKSDSSLTESKTQLKRTNSKLGLENFAVDEQEIAMKSSDELVQVPLEPLEITESINEKELEENELENSEVDATAVAANVNSNAPGSGTAENSAETQNEVSEDTKKSCLTQKAAKCRCLIS